jgi:hypothetical protein
MANYWDMLPFDMQELILDMKERLEGEEFIQRLKDRVEESRLERERVTQEIHTSMEQYLKNSGTDLEEGEDPEEYLLEYGLWDDWSKGFLKDKDDEVYEEVVRRLRNNWNY